jgi:DNA modification methylase
MIWNNLELPDKDVYFKDDDSLIYCSDCRDILPLIPDKSIDLIYADPPFNTQDGMGSKNRNYANRIVSNDRLSEIDYQTFCQEWFKSADIVTKRLVLTPGAKNIGRYGNPLWCVVISKPGAPSYNKFGGFNCWEPLLCFTKPVRPLVRDVVIYDSQNLSHGIESQHPCPDNFRMVDWIINLWSDVGELILDPFLGSGTTAYCAKKLGRKSIGIEIEEKYCKIAVDRLRQSVMRL